MSQARNSVEVDGRRLKQLRQRIGWTQESAAEKSGYTERLIRKLERGGPVQWQTLHDVLDTYLEYVADADPNSIRNYVTNHASDLLGRMARNWLEAAYNNRDLSVIDQFLAPDVILVTEGCSEHGRDAVRNHMQQVLSAFKPIEFVIDQVVSNDDNAVAVFWSMRKKHVATYRGIAETGRWVTVKGSTLMRCHRKKIKLFREHHHTASVLRGIQDSHISE